MIFHPEFLAWIIIGLICAVFLALEPFIGLRHRLRPGPGPSKKPDPTGLIGKHGITATPLRPSGFITIDGERHAAKAASGFLDGGVAVTVSRADAYALQVVPTEEKDIEHAGGG